MNSILIVDDSLTSRNYIASILLDQGFHVLLAQNGTDALEKLAETGCDLVVTDINMPVMDGLECIRRMRADQNFKSTPIIIMTIEGGPIDIQLGKTAGADAFLIKPIRPEHLLKAVNDLLNKHP
jgi:two-component system chemotaxis response regulator CheY